jgi:hypothetical protein
MGFFKKVGASLGHVDKHLLKTGILASGRVVECKMTGMGIGGDSSGNGSERVCDVTVDVSGVPGRETYRATCKHPIPLIYVPQMQVEGATVAVRVDPDDPQNIALDLATSPPEVADAGAGAGIDADPDAGSVTISGPDGDVAVPTHASPVKAADILTRGTAVRAALLMSAPLGQRNDAGLEVMALVFTVPGGNGQPYQAQIGVAVPAAAMPLLFPSSDLPARALGEWLANPSPPDLVTIDWDAAIAERA